MDFASFCFVTSKLLKRLHPHPKTLIGIFLALTFLLELRKARFSNIRSYLEKFPSSRASTLLFFLLGTVVLMICLLPFDSALLNGIHSISAPTADRIVQYVSPLGKSLCFWPVLIGAYFIGCLARRKNFTRYMFAMILASVLTGLLVQIMKFLFLRARPDSGFGPYSFFHPAGLLKDDSTFQSFPSGDVALIAGAASYLFFTVKNCYLRGLVFLLPLSNAFARMSLNRHWPSDTFASIMISLLIAKCILDYQHEERTLN